MDIWSTNNSSNKNGRENKTVFCIGLSAVLFAGGFLTPVLGLVLILVHASIEGDSVFGRIGTLLMVISIPMLLLASHFLDVAEQKK